MRNTVQRVGALLLCMIMLFSTLAVGAVSTDTVDGSVEYQANTLRQLGLVLAEELPEDMTSAVTRLQFAVAVSRIFGLEINASTEAPTTVFEDMADCSTEEIYAVKVLSDRGLISGTEVNLFSPLDPITQEQAAKILVCTLGYGTVAEEEGGYPAGYVARAAKLGLFDGFSYSGSQNLTWEVFLSMFYEALFADIMQPVYYSKDDPVYTVVQGENILTNLMQIGRVRAAMLTATDKTSLDGNGGVREGYVEIGGVLYEDNGDAEQYLGKLVDVYYKRYRDGSKAIIHIAATYDQSSVSLKIDPDVKVSGYTISFYNENGARQEITVDTNANMIYNGELLTYNPSLIDTANGQGNIYLRHSGDGGSYDLIEVEQYTNVIVKSVNADKNTIYDKKGGSLNMDSFVRNEACTIVKDGEELDVSDLQIDQILTVYVNASGDRVTVEVRNDVVSGTFEQLNDDTVKISGTAYKFDSGLRAELNRNLGKAGTAFLTPDDKIIYLEWDGTTGLQYGYFLQGATTGTFTQVLNIRLLNEKNKIETFEAAKTVTLKYQDGTENVTSDADIVATALQSGGAWKKQLIRYGLDDESKVKTICIADERTAAPFGKNDVDFYCSVATDNSTKYRYRSQNKTVSGRFAMTSNTPVFYVSPTGEDDDEAYVCGSCDTLENGDEKVFVAYNMNGGGLAGAVVCYRKLSSTIENKSPMMMIDYTAISKNADGQQTETLYGYVNGTYTEYQTDGLITTSMIGRSLKRGDIVACQSNKDGKIDKMALRVDVTKKLNDNPKLGSMNESSWGGTTYWAFSGAFYSVEDGYAIISRDMMPYIGNIFTTSDLPSKVYALPLAGKIVIYDASGDSISIGTTSDIVSYQEAKEDATRAYFEMNYTGIKNMYIYKFSD